MSWFMNHEVTHKSRGRLIYMSVPEFGEHAVVTWEIKETTGYIYSFCLLLEPDTVKPLK